MFPMKILKFIFLYLIVSLSISCTNNLNDFKIKSDFERSSNYGRFLSTKYSLKVGENEIASKIISKSKNLDLDITLAELNFNSYLINGNFDKAKKFKLIAPSELNKSLMYNLPDFVINLKNGKIFDPDNPSLMKSDLPGFKMIFEKINQIKLVKNNNYENVDIDLNKSTIFDLLIFENTKIENQIYSNMQKSNLSLIENILLLEYLKRKYPRTFDRKINDFSLRYNYDLNSLKLYFKKNTERDINHNFMFANLFAYLSFVLSTKKISQIHF